MIMTLKDLKEVLSRITTHGYEYVVTDTGLIRVFVHRKDFKQAVQIVKEQCVVPGIFDKFQFNKYPFTWDIKMWWRSR